ncbi:MAG: DUF1559 domain-containing protein [Gemmataceae bacterium]|nr:DUF1559 domain-containing protein [Gemmataceae bacterium]
MRRGRPGFTLIELLVVVGIVALLAALTLAAVQRVRAASARAACQNQLRQLALAAQHYHDARGAFPPGVSYKGGASPQPHMTWMTRLLPYLEQEPLWRQAEAAFAADKFFEGPPHLPILGRKVGLFVCPADPLAQEPYDFGPFAVGHTNYLGVSGLDLHSWDGVLHTDSEVAARAITDGTSNTLMIGERPVNDRHNFGWWYAGWGQNKTGSGDSILGVRERREGPPLEDCPPGPYRFRPGRADAPCDVLRYWSHHPGGANFACCDGSVRFLRYEADAVLPALATRAGGEVAELP